MLDLTVTTAAVCFLRIPVIAGLVVAGELPVAAGRSTRVGSGHGSAFALKSALHRAGARAAISAIRVSIVAKLEQRGLGTERKPISTDLIARQPNAHRNATGIILTSVSRLYGAGQAASIPILPVTIVA
jgi:hypothetical protein